MDKGNMGNGVLINQIWSSILRSFQSWLYAKTAHFASWHAAYFKYMYFLRKTMLGFPFKVMVKLAIHYMFEDGYHAGVIKDM